MDADAQSFPSAGQDSQPASFSEYAKIVDRLYRQLLGIAPKLAELKNKSPQELMLKLTGIDITVCPAGKKGTLKVIEKLPKQADVCLFDLFN